MSRADGKAERDRIEAEIARRNAAARQTSAETSSRAVSSETREERHRRIEEKTRQALRDLDESDPATPASERETALPPRRLGKPVRRRRPPQNRAENGLSPDRQTAARLVPQESVHGAGEQVRSEEQPRKKHCLRAAETLPAKRRETPHRVTKGKKEKRRAVPFPPLLSSFASACSAFPFIK